MFKNPFKVVPKSFIGIDIGVSSVKVVELSRWGGRVELKNYGKVLLAPFKERAMKTFGKDSFLLSPSAISKVIRSILKEAQIKTTEAAFTIPDFSTFFTTFELPSMTEAEISDAVNFEARQHIPVPVSDVVLDWYLTGGKIGKKGTKLKILLVAVPKDLINQYEKIATASKVNLRFLEAETFSLARSLTEGKKDTLCIVDIGVQSTTVNMIDEEILKASHSFDTSGNDLTQALSKSFDIDSQEAEVLKREKGLKSRETKDVLLPLVNLIIIEIEKTLRDFYHMTGKEAQRIIIAGGSGSLPGLVEFISSYFKKETIIANPFSSVFYPPVLEKQLEEMGPSFAVAIGSALRGLQ